MVQDGLGVVDGRVEAVAPRAETADLPAGEIVHGGILAACQMREDAAHLEDVLQRVEALGKGRYVVAGEA